MENYNIERIYKELMLILDKYIYSENYNICNLSEFYTFSINLNEYKKIRKLLFILAEDNKQLKYKKVKYINEINLTYNKKSICNIAMFDDLPKGEYEAIFHIKEGFFNFIKIEYEKSILDELILNIPIKKLRRL